MRVNIDEIKEAGLRTGWDVSRETVEEMVSGDRAGYHAQGPVRVEVSLTKIERRVLLTMRARPVFRCECRRCLVPVDVEVPVDFELTLVPEDEYETDPRDQKDDGQSAVAGTFDPESADEEVYRGKAIDLDPILREQIVLALPGSPVCKESCRGLCTVCGGNLNERECGCERRVPDPRWAGLEKFKRQQ